VFFTLFIDCEIQPDVNLSGRKFIIKLFIPGAEGIAEEWLRCEDVSI